MINCFELYFIIRKVDFLSQGVKKRLIVKVLRLIIFKHLFFCKSFMHIGVIFLFEYIVEPPTLFVYNPWKLSGNQI